MTNFIKRALQLTAAMTVLLVSLAATSVAQATPTQKCGGQGALHQVYATYSCYNELTISGVTIRADVVVNPDGTYAVTYTLSKAVNVIVGLQVRAHNGFSGVDGFSVSFGTMAKGQTVATLTGAFEARALATCTGNQLDVKAIPGQQGSAVHFDAKYRISGATFIFPNYCDVTPTTTAAPTTTVAATGSTTAGSTVATTTGVVVSAAAVRGSLPATGGDDAALIGLAVALVSFGVFMVVWVRRKPATS